MSSLLDNVLFYDEKGKKTSCNQLQIKLNDEEEDENYKHNIKLKNLTYISDYDLHKLIKFLDHNKKLSINDKKIQKLIFNTQNKCLKPEFNFNIPDPDLNFFGNFKTIPLGSELDSLTNILKTENNLKNILKNNFKINITGKQYNTIKFNNSPFELDKTSLNAFSIYNFICTFNPEFKVSENGDNISDILDKINQNEQKFLIFLEISLNLHGYRTLLVPTSVALKLLDAHTIEKQYRKLKYAVDDNLDGFVSLFNHIDNTSGTEKNIDRYFYFKKIIYDSSLKKFEGNIGYEYIKGQPIHKDDIINTFLDNKTKNRELNFHDLDIDESKKYKMNNLKSKTKTLLVFKYDIDDSGFDIQSNNFSDYDNFSFDELMLNVTKNITF